MNIYTPLKLIVPVILLGLTMNPVKGQDIIVSEINYHADSTRDAGSWVELYNRGTSPVDITNWVFSDDDPAHFFIIPGKTMNPGEYAVLVQDQAQFATQYPGLANVIPGSFIFGLSNRTDQIRLFDGSNALEFSMQYADSAGWPKCADGHGRTLEVRNPFGNFSDPLNWFDGCMMGSPGTAHVPCSEPIIFSEVNYHSTATHDAGDWVELRNISGANVDLSNWVFKDDNDSNAFVIPSGFNIPAGENRVIAADIGKFYSFYPSVSGIGPLAFNFSKSKDILRLYDNTGLIQYSLRYKDAYPWPVDADGGGYTLELIDPAAIVNDGNDWMIGCYGGSPGTYYNAGCLVGIRENKPDETKSLVFPNPFNDKAMIKVDTDEAPQKLSVIIFNVLGKRVAALNNARASNGSNSVFFDLNFQSLVSGLYFYQVMNENSIMNSGHFVVKR